VASEVTIPHKHVLSSEFNCAGDVMFADMKSENGRPAGYGTVRFKNPDDAMKAISILCYVTSRILVCKHCLMMSLLCHSVLLDSV